MSDELKRLNSLMAAKKSMARFKYAFDLLVLSRGETEDLSRVHRVDVSTYENNITLNCHRNGLASLTFSCSVPPDLGEEVAGQAADPAAPPAPPAEADKAASDAPA